MLARIQRAVDDGNEPKAKGLQRRLLTSFSGRLCAVASVNPKLRSAERARSSELVSVAARISAFRAAEEEVKVVAANKTSGGWRPITVFGLDRAALQTLTCWAIRPFHTADRRQYALTGGGHNEAARHIRQGLVDGFTWFVGLDISSFYASIERSLLNQIIPLPMKAVEHVILPPPAEAVRIVRAGRALCGLRLAEASQSGISQGSRSSPLIAEIIVKEILTQLPLDVRIINVADDFGILARSKRDADAIQMALTRASARSPAGRFQLRSKVHIGPRRTCDGFDFLGYRFRKRRSHIQCEASDANLAKFNGHVCDLADLIRRGAPNAIPALRRYVKQWWGSFPLMRAHCCDRDFFWARHHTFEVVRRHRPQVAPLVSIAMDWDGDEYAALPPRPELAELARSIRRANPTQRSRVPHWR